MPRMAVGGIELEYESFGDASHPALLLIQGLGSQMIHWPEGLCELLAERGHRVLRFDNRDVGRSSVLDHLETPGLAEVAARRARGEPLGVPYRLEDMADDALGLLDGLGVARAHVVGVSMGGMIAQTLAARRPERVLTLTSLMSSTGEPELPPPTPEALELILTPLPAGREAYVERGLEGAHICNGSGFPVDEGYVRRRAERCYDRGTHPDGFRRQLLAVVASGSRAAMLAGVTVPTLVIHGDEDPLIPLPAGEATARAIPGARLEVVRGMGHDMMPASWPLLADLIAAHTRRVSGAGCT